MAIVLREVKGSNLTPAEVDNNFLTLDTGKLNKSLYNTNNTFVVKDDAGELVELVVDFSKIIGRLSTGEIIAMAPAELKGMLEIAIDDVSGLQDALDAIDTAIGLKQDAIDPDTGWFAPTGIGSKTAFDPLTVTLPQLGAKVKSIIDALMAAGILTE